jgi:putative membrane protein
MIPRFSDHATNERTYLAWVRTAIAVMAFGFLLERFDIFLSYASHAADQAIPGLHVRASE